MRREHEHCAKYRFGQFELDASSGELRKNGLKVRLQDQPCQVLLALLESPGQLVTREQLRQQLWSGGTFVEFDHALNTAVKKLRAALSDNASVPRYVETIPRRGYRFIAPVSQVIDAGNSVQNSSGQSLPAAMPGSRPVVVAAILLLAALAAVVSWRAVSTVSNDRAKPVITLSLETFKNMSDDAASQPICVGLRQDLTAELGRIDPEHLLISARDDLSPAPSRIPPGGRTGVDYILRGSLRRDASRIRVSVQLIRTRDENYVWADNFDHRLGEPLASESELAADIVGHLKTVLAAQQMASR